MTKTAYCLLPTAHLYYREGRLVSKRRIWQIIRNVILILAALVAGFFFLFVPWFVVNIGTTGRYHYPDPNDGKTPISYRMDFKWVEFPTSDGVLRSEEHTSELQSRPHLVCRLLLEKKK